MRKILYLASLVALSAIIIIACQREVNELKTNPNVFDVATAKEWWYGNFRKTAFYSNINFSSPLAPPEGLSDRKYPIWNKAISYKKNNTEVVEVPLVFATNKVLLPNMQDLENTQEIVRIAKSRINKLIIIKKTNGEQVVRIASIIPTPKYAKEHSYDISNVHPNSLPQDFEGYMAISDWGLNLKSFVRIEKGRIVENIKIVTSAEISPNSNSREYTENEPCEPVWIPNYVWVCAIVPTGDALADAEHCQEIGHWVASGGEWQIPDCGSGGPNPLQDCLQSNSAEECYCLIWSIGCEDIGGGGEEPPSAPDLIQNAVDDSCIRHSVDYAITQGCKNEITSFINSTFDTSSTYHLLFRSGPIPAHPNNVAYTTTGPLSPQSFEQTNTIIMFNTNILNSPSKEYVVSTILHEAIHAWINYQYPEPPTNAQQHNQMTNSDRFNKVLDALLELCPSLRNQTNTQDAIDLVWGGLEATAAYVNLPIADKQRIQQTNLAYKNGTKGSPCN